MDIVVKTAKLKTSKKAKVVKSSNHPPSLVLVHLRPECSYDKEALRIPSTEELCSFVLPFGLEEEDGALCWVHEAMCIDTFVTMVYSNILMAKVKYNISHSSRMYRLPLSGRCSGLEAIGTTADLAAAIGACKTVWIDPQDETCGSMADLFLSFGLSSPTSVGISEDSVGDRKKSKNYTALKQWVVECTPFANLPDKLKRSTSLAYTGEEIESEVYSQDNEESLALNNPSDKPASSSSRSVASNLRFINLDKLFQRLNLNPESYLYHGITNLHKQLWSGFLVSKTELSQDVFSNTFDSGEVTALMIATKKWSWDWHLHLYSQQLGGVFPQKDKYPPLGSDHYLRHTSVTGYQAGGSGNNSTSNSSTGLAAAITTLAGSFSTSSSTTLSTTFVNVVRLFDNCFHNKPSYPVTISINPADEALTISSMLRAYRTTNKNEYNNLLNLGSLKGGEISITYSVVLHSDDALKGSTRVIRADAAKTITLLSLAKDSALAHPMTIQIVLSEKEEDIGEGDVADLGD